MYLCYTFIYLSKITMHTQTVMPTKPKKDSDTPSNSVVQPISMKRDFYEVCAAAAAMEGLTFAAHARRLLYLDAVKKGLISDKPTS